LKGLVYGNSIANTDIYWFPKVSKNFWKSS